MRAALLWLLPGAALLAIGQGHVAIGAAAVVGLVCVLVAFRRGPLGLAVVSFTALHVGVMEVAYRGMIPLGTAARIGMEAGTSLVLALLFVVDARFWRLRAPGDGWTSLPLPIGLVAFDFLSARLSPGASWGSLAYSFVEATAIAQLAALTGWVGLTFLAAWIASMLASLPELSRALRRRRLITLAAVSLAVLGLGQLRLLLAPAPAEADMLSAACVVAPSTYTEDIATLEDVWAYTRGVQDERYSWQRGQARIEASLQEHLDLAQQAFDGGAQFVAFAEANASISTAERQRWLMRAGQLAREEQGWLALGLMQFRPQADGISRNETVVLGPDGGVFFEYLKASRTPGAGHAIQDRLAEPVALGSATLSGAICFDLDFPHFFSALGRAGIDLLLAPSNDWQEAAATHARMARMRAIEEGFAILRPTKDGISLACDRYGRVLASENTLGLDRSILPIQLPLAGASTVYAHSRDAFAWLCLLSWIASGLHVFLRRSHRRKREPDRGPRQESGDTGAIVGDSINT